MTDHVREILNNPPKWVFSEIDEEKINRLKNEIGLSPLICRLLIRRGIDSYESFKRYTRDDTDLLYNPFLFNDMEKAVGRVKRAVEEGEEIFVFGDRDVDGVLSTAMMFNMLRLFDAKVSYKVPEGEYGYGIEIRDIELAKEKGVKLIITVDTGISSYDEIEYAKKLEIDTIIIDHHLQPQRIPDAYAIINPKLEGEKYPYKYLSGGGTVLKFIHAYILSYTKNYNKVFYTIKNCGENLESARVRNGIIEEYITLLEDSINIKPGSLIVKDYRETIPEYLLEWSKGKDVGVLNLVCKSSINSIEDFAERFSKLYLKKQKKSLAFMNSFIDLAAISTIADIMPLTDENRVIVKRGLKQIKKTINLGLRVLARYCDIDEGEITAKQIAWKLAPVINSAGRMGEAGVAVELFTTEDDARANEISRLLLEMNSKRKEKGEKNFNIINPMVEEKYYKDPVIILSTSEAEHGVTGIIASKIARKYSKPAIVIVNDGKIGVGSGRGGKNVDLVSLISYCSDLLVKYGGHKSAVGFTIETENIEEFRERIRDLAERKGESLIGREIVEIDAVIKPEDITFELFQSLKVFEPVGTGNEPPKFSILGTSVINPVIFKSDKNHIRFYIPSENGLIPVIGWGIGEKAKAIIDRYRYVDIAFYIEEDSFRGDRGLQLVLQDIRPSED